jgi:hypothetical protein
MEEVYWSNRSEEQGYPAYRSRKVVGGWYLGGSVGAM